MCEVFKPHPFVICNGQNSQRNSVGVLKVAKDVSSVLSTKTHLIKARCIK